MVNTRKLTTEEIEDVVQSLPRFQAAITKVAIKMREEVQKKLRAQLKDIKLADNPKAIERLKEIIIQQHYNSLVPAGEPVGIRAGEAMSQPTTQMALNAFHSAGTASLAAMFDSGIDAMEELYQVKKVRKKEMCRIHFKNKDLSFEDIVNLRRDIVGATVESLLEARFAKQPKYYDSTEEPWWYNLYFDLNPSDRKIFAEGQVFLRLNLNKRRLYEFNLTLSDVARAMTRSRGIICIPSPTYEGFIDIFVDNNIITYNIKKKLKNTSGLIKDCSIENCASLFLNLILIPSLKDICVSGVPGITQIIPLPNDVSVISMLADNQDLLDANERVWRLYIKRIDTILQGVPIKKIVDTIKLSGLEVLNTTGNNIDVKIPSNLTMNDKTPIEIITSKITEAKEELKKQSEDGKYPIRKKNALFEAGFYNYAVSYGTNLQRLLAHPLVDATTTISSNPHEVLKTLGIEAARNFMIDSYESIVKANGEYVNGRHINLLADYQTSRGTLLQFTSRGSAQQNVGTLAKASFEEPMPAFVDAAAFGKSEKIKSTSTSIFVGKRMIMGTGCFKARIDKEAFEEADKIHKAFREANPDKYSIVSDTSQKSMARNFVSDDDLLCHSAEDQEEGGREDKKIGLIGLDIVNTIQPPVEAELKYFTPIPSVIISTLSLPDFINNIIKKSIIGEDKKMSSKPVIKTVIQPRGMIRAIVPNSISKPGLPAIPKLSSSQMASIIEVTKPKEIDLDDNTDEFDI